ncbi:hypothetical protein G4B88_003137 [Cannabis sativa]|uniref:Uncharacterized protein n=1 Tax=Cannabis sativa TaxID=3483 RepID=A0A7J6F6Z1_CANSA|nr:hypothetical protein G4B88_003137 [Cannabis sativa]
MFCLLPPSIQPKSEENQSEALIGFEVFQVERLENGTKDVQSQPSSEKRCGCVEETTISFANIFGKD